MVKILIMTIQVNFVPSAVVMMMLIKSLTLIFMLHNDKTRSALTRW